MKRAPQHAAAPLVSTSAQKFSPLLKPLSDRRVSDLSVSSEYSRSSTPVSQHHAMVVGHGNMDPDGDFLTVGSDSEPELRPETEWGSVRKKEDREGGFAWVPYHACVEEGVFAWYTNPGDVVSQGSVTMPYLQAEVDDTGRFLRVKDLAPGHRPVDEPLLCGVSLWLPARVSFSISLVWDDKRKSLDGAAVLQANRS